MKRQENRFQTRGAELEILDKEHSEIHRRYFELDNVILHGQGSARILEAARELVQSMGQHFTHEEQFQEVNSIPILEMQHNAEKKIMAEIMTIAAGLRQKEVYAALRLRALCKGWLHEHMYVESVEFGIAALASAHKTKRIQTNL